MTITLNGQIVEALEAVRLSDFVAQRGLKADRVAVERNGEIVPRHIWQHVILEAGDRLEVVHFVGGGCPISR